MGSRILKYLLVLLIVSAPLAWNSEICANTCNPSEGTLNINLTGTYGTWAFSWDARRLKKQKAKYNWKDFDNRMNMQGGVSDKRSEGLPKSLAGQNNRFDIPFAYSHNGEKAIAAIHHDGYALPLSRRFALIDIKNAKLVRTFDTEYYVESVAWSPSDKYFAILASEDATKQKKWKGPLDFLGKLLGHPISYYTFHVTIRDALSGNEVCRRTIVEQVEQGRGYVEWK